MSGSIPTALAPAALAEIQAAITAFTIAEAGRAVALRTLRGPDLDLAIGADVPMPAASLIKLPLAMTVYDLADAGRIDLDRRVPRRELGTTAYPSILAVFDPAHEFTVGELVGVMLSTSDNPAACFLADLAGTDQVNRTLARLGAHATRFAVGFTDELLGQPGRATLTTAADQLTILAAMVAEARYRPLLAGLRNSMRNFRIPLRLPDELPVAHKTGSLAGVANDAGGILGGSVELAAVFLTDDQADTAATSLAIGDCVARVWDALIEDGSCSLSD